MSAGRTPDWYDFLQHNHQNCMSALGWLGKTIREGYTLDIKTTHLVQLTGATAIRAESVVQSHVR